MMINRSLICLLFVLLSASFAEAQTFQGVDITPLVNYYKKFVRTLKKPVVMYNWSQGGDHPYWTADLAPNDPSLWWRARNSSEVFWERYGDPNGAINMYGIGLYLAVDPIISVHFGGYVSTWVLGEFTLPVGFKFVDANEYGESLLENRNIAAEFGCTNHESLRESFAAGGPRLKPSCRELVNEIFGKLLKIDGFSFSYSKHYFNACPSNSDASVAFVITGSEWIGPDSYNYFTAKTKGAIEKRRMIQSLFLDSSPDTLITAKAAKYSALGLLWKDLDGTPKATKANEWLKENKFGCSGELPYDKDAK